MITSSVLIYYSFKTQLKRIVQHAVYVTESMLDFCVSKSFREEKEASYCGDFE